MHGEINFMEDESGVHVMSQTEDEGTLWGFLLHGFWAGDDGHTWRIAAQMVRLWTWFGVYVDSYPFMGLTEVKQ